MLRQVMLRQVMLRQMRLIKGSGGLLFCGISSPAAPAPGGLAEPPLLMELPGSAHYWALILSGLLLIAVVLVRFRLKTRTGPAESDPAVDPGLEAMSGLAALGEKIPDSRDKEDVFHVSLSRILRQYISRRYEGCALDMTTEEILCSLAAAGLFPARCSELESLLHGCDRIKFGARFRGAGAARDLLHKARGFVEETAQ